MHGFTCGYDLQMSNTMEDQFWKLQGDLYVSVASFQTLLITNQVKFCNYPSTKTLEIM